jgi:hypothetical protein
MATQTPFQPMGKTVLAVANGTSAIVNIVADSPCNQFRFFNANSSVVFVTIGNAAGNTSATIPTAGTPAYGIPIASGAQDITLTGWQSGGFSNVVIALISTGPNVTSQVYITPGEGFRG